MARLYPILRALATAAKRERRTFQSIATNNFFVASALLLQEAGVFVYLIGALVVLFPMSADPLRKIPADRLALWPLTRGDLRKLRLLSPWINPLTWVLAGLAMVLQRMPEHYRDRGKYVAQYKEMAERIAGLQQSDGLWRASLLDPASYPNPEISGSAFYTYAMAWGVRHGILDRKKYMPVIGKAWAGMLTHVYADGRLGSIQPIGGEPGKFKPSSSWVYGVGAFLLAGAELSEIEGK